MTALDDIPGNLLRKPSGKPEDELERAPSNYKPLHSFKLDKEKSYQQQFADMYFLRLTKIKPAVEQLAAADWEGAVIGDEPVKKVERVLDIRQGELCWVSGTVYMDMSLKPNILEDVSKDRWLSAPISDKKYYSEDGTDAVTLEDESGRIRLVGDALNSVILVTGCIIAVMGTENVNGELEVIDLKFPDLPPQPDRWALSKPITTNGSSKNAKVKKDEDSEMTDSQSRGSGSKLAIVSGLGFSGNDASHAIELSLLLEYLLGESLDPSAQQELSQISRLIIAGNSISLEERRATDEDMTEKKANKKYGYDSSAYNALPSQLFDEFLSTLLPTMPVTLLPGAQDPANTSYPQQPIHPAMFPHSRPYTMPPSTSSDATEGWLDTVTNPWEAEVEGWRVLGTGGQNVDDIFKYVGSDDRLGMMEAMCRWRCCAPTAPDTLWSYPFQDDDPFVMQTCPHLYFVGCQPEFGTKVVQGPEGQTVRLIAVPSFAATQELVLVDTETLEVSKVKITAG
ncbi:DNA polymerase alpha/epsilon subunit B-domain-containing protein [Hypoxylon trugodes]|uniref:DNA polymerase alpha/epsilon subunit B-domain-containing protein n=1 Tax=Hypoxylon trugodes TaxID=326681 RepID=UPI00219258AE|nr:DNA polymerase alpha/epsilon subunit B-domain-containing protein [Hypoxylon trugodes]KAI1390964.1 DNA polymerase alpha/epsilon subunit B-domain-containing protein [Hypoxylon trugodes]